MNINLKIHNFCKRFVIRSQFVLAATGCVLFMILMVPTMEKKPITMNPVDMPFWMGHLLYWLFGILFLIYLTYFVTWMIKK